MPDVDHPIIATAGDLGWCMSGGMGPCALTSAEIMAWCEGMGETLTPWEFSTLRSMSAAFVSGLSADRAPYMPLVVRLGLVTAAIG